MKQYVIACCVVLFFSGIINAQTPGIIVRPAGGGGPVILDPNANGYTSQSTSGFGSSDITNSEILYKLVAPVIPEPTGDLLRGPGGKFTDIVKTFDGSGFYLFSDGTNLLCRLRIGGIVSGSKGYSILLDTDQRFGPSGPNADPNYQAATNGNNGNPGFEYEVVLETNFRVAVYNVNGTSTPVLVTSYPLTTHSQVSVAATTDGNNPDFFYDFYVPYSVMGLSSSSIIRATATTVMSPGPAIGGPKSDIYGLAGTNYMEDWTTIINQQPSFAISQLTNAGTGISAPCTAAPVVNSGLTSSSTQVSGTWTNSIYSTRTRASIKIYNGAVLIGTIDSVNAGATWQFAVSNLPDGSLITARAHAANETMCLSSNEVKVKNCNASNHTATPVFTCIGDRGFEGTRVAGASVKLYKLTSSGYVLLGDDATTLYRITYPSTTTWRYDNVNTQSGSACTGGPRDIDDGAYVATATLAPNCESLPAAACIGNSGTTATPVVTSFIVDGLSSIAGTATANAGVMLWIDDYFVQAITALPTGAFTFTLADKLANGQVVKIRAVATGFCESATVTATVTCFVAPPVINANSSGRVTVGSQLTGISSAVTGSTITIYNASTLAIINTTTVQVNGTWTLASPTIAAATTYLARVTGHACGTSSASNTVTAVTGTNASRCGSITAPANEFVTSVSGSLGSFVAGTVVVLFADGDSIGTVTTATNTNPNWTIAVNTNVYTRIYSGADLTISVAQSIDNTSVTCAATTPVPCATPTAPAISPAATTIFAGQSVTYTITSPQSGILYSIRDNADAVDAGASGFGSGASMTLTSNTFSTPGNYNLKIKATSLAATGCPTSSSNATVTVLGSLPLSLTTFNGMYENGIVKLNWETIFEQDIEKFEIERSTTPTDFSKIGEVTAVGNSSLRNNYFFNDASGKSNVLYYRLKIIDKSSAAQKYSKIIVIRTDKGIVINQVSPNPFSDEINMSFNASGKMPLLITLSDMGGRLIKKVNYITQKGLNIIPVNGLHPVSAGTYVIEIMAGGDRIYKELLIKR